MINTRKEIRIDSDTTLTADIKQVYFSYDMGVPSSYTIIPASLTEMQGQWLLLHSTGGETTGAIKDVYFDPPGATVVIGGGVVRTKVTFRRNTAAYNDFGLLYCDGVRWILVASYGGVVS